MTLHIPKTSDFRRDLDAIAKQSVLADEHDLPRLTSMLDDLESVSARLESADLEKIAECVSHAADLVQQVILREVENADGSLELIRRCIEFAQRAVVANDEGRPLSDAGPSPIAQRAVCNDVGPVDKELLESWIAGCTGGLSELEMLVVAIDNGDAPADTQADVRRRLHTLKGECGVLSLCTAQKTFHEAESAVDRCIAAGNKFPTEAFLLLIDWMRGYVAALSRDPSSPPNGAEIVLQRLREAPIPASSLSPIAPEARGVDIPPTAPTSAIPATSADDAPIALTVDPGMQDNVNEFLCESREHLAGSEQALLELEKDPSNKELINTVFRAFHTIKGVAGFLNISGIVRLAHSAEFLLDAARSDRVVLEPAILNLILKSCDLMSSMLKALEGVGTAPSGRQLSSLVDSLERATRGETLSDAAPAAQAATPTPTPNTPAPASTGTSVPTTPNAQAETATPAPTQAKRVDQTVKVSTQRMDALVDMVGELVIAQQMVVQDPAVRGLRDQRVARNLTMVGKIIRDLQAVSMSLRMVPVKATFQKMARLVRDVSAKAGKRITLHTEGEDVEIDRTVVEEIADPLVHMIRNACDHGIEPPEKRLAAGKPEDGNIWLRAYHSGGSILIEIEDDGKGLDRTRIIAKAVEKGLIPADRKHDEITDSEAFNLVFLPGFSTAEKVTDLSGRGVGMDVVRRNIEALRGKVDISSVVGRGTVFTMRLPLTLAIIDGMVVRVGTQRYVIPTLSIVRSFQPTPGHISTIVGRGRTARVRDSLLPVFRLAEVLQGVHTSVEDRDPLLIVVENQGCRACLAVDEIVGQQQVVIKSLGQNVQPVRGVSGGAILGDGRVALILDIGGILSVATEPDRAVSPQATMSNADHLSHQAPCQT